jgi:hypothetical protein
MKHKPSLKPTEEGEPGKRPPVAVEPAAGAGEMAVLTVPECDSDDELAGFCDALLGLLETRPKRVTFRFIGAHEMAPDPALLVYDILTTRGNGSQIVTEAWSPVLGSSVLVWLAGHVRRIRSTTHFHFRSLQEITRRRRQHRPPWENHFEALAGDAEPEANPWTTDYKKVLELMDQYLPVDQCIDKFMTPAMLNELGLLENSPLDNLMGRCLARPAPDHYAQDI